MFELVQTHSCIFCKIHGNLSHHLCCQRKGPSHRACNHLPWFWRWSHRWCDSPQGFQHRPQRFGSHHLAQTNTDTQHMSRATVMTSGDQWSQDVTSGHMWWQVVPKLGMTLTQWKQCESKEHLFLQVELWNCGTQNPSQACQVQVRFPSLFHQAKTEAFRL